MIRNWFTASVDASAEVGLFAEGWNRGPSVTGMTERDLSPCVFYSCN